jgi:2-aminoadipate transaminase
MKPEDEKNKVFFADRMNFVPRSFIRDILKVAVSPEIISFAGGLPNKRFFPAEELRESANRILGSKPDSALQYSNTEGLVELREYLVSYYARQHIELSTDNILITTGSQQALDLLGKVLINENDPVIMEEPAYLGAIQAFSVFRPRFIPVPLHGDGIDTFRMEQEILRSKARMMYCVVNFQNPSGISYSSDKRKHLAELANKYNFTIIEDDPYGQICFKGKPGESIYTYAHDRTIMLGTFSKTIVPGIRIGWIAAHSSYIEKLAVAKQAADLHTDVFAQQLVLDYLSHNSQEEHIAKITSAYYLQASAMLEAIEKSFPQEVKYTKPEGGMFLWMTLPNNISSMKLFELSIRKNVAFVPGFPFYINKTDTNTLRLNFSCSEPEEIEEGINRLATCYCELAESV